MYSSWSKILVQSKKMWIGVMIQDLGLERKVA